MEQEFLAKCERCLFSPDPDKLEDLGNFLNNSEISTQLLQTKCNALIYIVHTIIKKIPMLRTDPQISFSGDNILRKCLNIYNILFKKISIDNSNVFENLFKTFIWLIDRMSSNAEFMSEVSSKLLLECTINFICASDYKMLIKMQNFEMIIGLLSGCLLKIIAEEKYHLLKTYSLNLMSAVYLKTIGISFEEFDYTKLNARKNELENICRYFAFILPGTLSKMWKLINVCSNEDYYKLHSDVIISSLKLSYICLQIVFFEGQNFNDQDRIIDDKIPKESINESWLEKISSNLSLILLNINTILVGHPDRNVNLNLLKFNTSLICNCCEQFTITFLKVLLKVPLNYIGRISNQSIFSESQINDELTNHCQEFKNNFYTKILFISNKINIIDLLHKELFTHIQQLPYLFRDINTEMDINTKKIITKSNLKSTFYSLIGYFNLLNQSGLYDFLKLEQHNYYLFRNLINIAEFDFKSSKSYMIELSEENDNFTYSDYMEKNSDLIRHLFNIFKFEKNLLYLTDEELLQNYFSSLSQLCISSNFYTFQIIIDYLIQLLESSDFEPTVVLIINILLTTVHQLDYKDKLELYLKELISLYLKNLHTNDIYSGEDLINQNTEENDKFLTLSSLSTICSTNNNNNNNNSIKSIENNSKKVFRRKLMQHCLVMKGLTLLYSLFDPDQIRNEFYEKLFIQLVQSLANHYTLVSSVAKSCLIFISNHIDPTLLKTVKTTNLMLNQIILNNMDYVYSSFSISLEYSIHHSSTKSSQYLYSYDFYSIKTIQSSLLIIIGLMSEYHNSTGLITSSQMDYLNQLIDQILSLVKYYSIKSIDIDPNDLNRLLEILYEYEKLISLVYDDQQFSPSLNKRLEFKIEASVNDAIQELESFLETCLIMNTFFDNQSSTQNDQKHVEDQDNAAETILESPIIKSRIGNILHLCPMILSDRNIEIRLNVLQISFYSMKLLRSYEDILLPYVHRLWESLVKRFSLDFEHPLVMKRAFDCLMLASELCGDFLLRQTRKEVLPFLVDFLQVRFDRRINYYRKHKRYETIKTIDYYAEYELLQSLGQLTVNIKLSSQDIWNIIPILLLYICTKGIVEDLQKCSFQSLITLADKSDQYSIRFYVHFFLETFYEDQFQSLNYPMKNSHSKCNCSQKRNQFYDVIKKYSDLLLKLQNCLMADMISYLNC